MVTHPYLCVTSIHRDGAGDDPQRQQAASTGTPSETQGPSKREPRRHAQPPSGKRSSAARHADEHTRESGRLRGAAQGCPPTWSLHLYIQGFGVRKAQTAFSPLPPPLEGTGPPPQRCAGGKHGSPGLLSFSVQLEEIVRHPPPPPPVPALQEQKTGTKGTRKARLPGGWKWKPVVRH